MNSIKEKMFGERLLILNKRMQGLMSRLHYMKRHFANKETRLEFFPSGDKNYENLLKQLMKKFPNSDIRANKDSVNSFKSIKVDFFRLLEPHYNTLIDVLSTRDHVLELMNLIAVEHISLDININYSLTCNYLDLIVNYFSMMVLFTRLEDRKLILALFNLARELSHGPDNRYPRFAEIVSNFETLIQQLHSDMRPHSNLIKVGLISLTEIINRRKELLSPQYIKIFQFFDNPENIRGTLEADEVLLNIVSMDKIERWIVFGFLVIYTEFTSEECWRLWINTMSNSFTHVLHRDEILHTHAIAIEFFENIRNYKHRTDDVRDNYKQVCLTSALQHRKVRRFLRNCLREMFLLLSDDPGLLGPKAQAVTMALCLARDEVNWLIRHRTNPPPKKVSGISTLKINQDDFCDEHIAELIYYIERLGNLLKKHRAIIQKFYFTMMHSYDLAALAYYLKDMSLPIEEERFLREMLEEVRRIDENSLVQGVNFKALRIDWLRLQTNLSSTTGPFKITEQRKFGSLINSLCLHSQFVDSLDQLLNSVTDFSILFFYQDQFKNLFDTSLTKSHQHRFIVAYPVICAHFMRATHKLCPEEHSVIQDKAFRFGYDLCLELCDRVIEHVKNMCMLIGQQDTKLLPREAVCLMAAQKNVKKSKKSNQSHSAGGTLSKQSAKNIAMSDPSKVSLPGTESFRKYRDEDFTNGDKNLMVISDIVYSLNSIKEITIGVRKINLLNILHCRAECMLYKLVNGSFSVSPVSGQQDSTERIAQPSELLHKVRSYFGTLNYLEYILGINSTLIFDNVFRQISLLQDQYEEKYTLTYYYSRWYRFTLLGAACKDQVIYSPLLKSFVTSPLHLNCQIHPEEYADLNELKSLADLLGPLGMRVLFDQLMEDVGVEFREIRSLTMQNRNVLEQLRVAFSRIKETRALLDQLVEADQLLNRLKRIGLILAFRNLCQEAMHDVYKLRIPFLVESVENLHRSQSYLQCEYPLRHELRFCRQPDVCRLSSALGLRSELDALLCDTLRNCLKSTPTGGQILSESMQLKNDYNLACLFLVFVACVLPRLLPWDHAQYRPELDAHDNNSHCIALAVNSLLTCLFTISGENDVSHRITEFVALSSLHMLRHGIPARSSGSMLELEMSNDLSNINHVATVMMEPAATIADSCHFNPDSSTQNPGTLMTSSGNTSSLSSANSNALSGTSINSQQRQQLHSLYIMLYQVISASPYVTSDLLESCFPYALVRSAHHNVYTGTVLRNKASSNMHAFAAN